MTPPRPDDLDPTVEESERGELLAIASRLESERGVPSAAFRSRVRRSLLGDPARTSPRRARALVAAYSLSGAALMAIAAIGVAGAGPLAY